MPSNPIDQHLQPSPQTVRHPDGRDQLCRCSACDRIAFNAWETPHGCRLCGHCHGRLTRLEAGQPCPGRRPSCQDSPDFRRQDCQEDALTRAKLAQVVVRCPDQRCSYAGKFVQLQGHHLPLECQFRWLRCQCGSLVRCVNLVRHQGSDECRQFILENLGNCQGEEVSLMKR